MVNGTCQAASKIKNKTQKINETIVNSSIYQKIESTGKSLSNTRAYKTIDSGISKVKETYDNMSNKVEDWYYGFEQSKKIPICLILEKLSYNNSIKLLAQLNLDNKVKVNFNNIGIENNINTWLSP